MDQRVSVVSTLTELLLDLELCRQHTKRVKRKDSIMLTIKLQFTRMTYAVCSGGGERGEMGEQREGEEEDEGKELTLAQKMEKIKSCRYIRHYRPDGTAVDEPYELFH